MASCYGIIICVVCLGVPVLSKPLEISEKGETLISSIIQPHSIEKRFINPSLTLGGFADIGFNKIRTKRSEDECKKLHLCKLHARSSSSLFSAYELYFVNKENARLWDHHPRTSADCNRRYSGCYKR